MPHFPKPFFKPSRGVWYVEIDRHQHNLGPDRDEAFRQYYQLMGQPRERKVSAESLAAITDAFLEWVERNRSAETYEWYRYRLQRFIERYPDLRASELRPMRTTKPPGPYCRGWARRAGGTKEALLHPDNPPLPLWLEHRMAGPNLSERAWD